MYDRNVNLLIKQMGIRLSKLFIFFVEEYRTSEAWETTECLWFKLFSRAFGKHSLVIMSTSTSEIVIIWIMPCCDEIIMFRRVMWAKWPTVTVFILYSPLFYLWSCVPWNSLTGQLSLGITRNHENAPISVKFNSATEPFDPGFRNPF